MAGLCPSSLCALTSAPITSRTQLRAGLCPSFCCHGLAPPGHVLTASEARCQPLRSSRFYRFTPRFTVPFSCRSSSSVTTHHLVPQPKLASDGTQFNAASVADVGGFIGQSRLVPHHLSCPVTYRRLTESPEARCRAMGSQRAVMSGPSVLPCLSPLKSPKLVFVPYTCKVLVSVLYSACTGNAGEV